MAESPSRVRLLRPHALQPHARRLLCPMDAPGKSTGVWCHFCLQGTGDLSHPVIEPVSLALAGEIFFFKPLSHQGSPNIIQICTSRMSCITLYKYKAFVSQRQEPMDKSPRPGSSPGLLCTSCGSSRQHLINSTDCAKLKEIGR